MSIFSLSLAVSICLVSVISINPVVPLIPSITPTGGHYAFSLYRYVEDTPVSAPSPEPTPESTPEPVAEPTPKPTREPSPKPSPRPTPEPTPEETPESSTEEEPDDYDYGVFPYDGSTFTGDGTYYGETSDGNCAIRSPIPTMYTGMIPGKRLVDAFLSYIIVDKLCYAVLCWRVARSS